MRGMSTTTELTQEEKRVLIAEACIPGLTGPYGCYSAPELSGRVNGEEWILPDYFGSLDAMHGAEKVLTDEQQALFCYFLADPDEDRETIRHLVDCQWLEKPCGEWFQIFHATAAQRAEAFGKTLNLW